MFYLYIVKGWKMPVIMYTAACMLKDFYQEAIKHEILITQQQNIFLLFP